MAKSPDIVSPAPILPSLEGPEAAISGRIGPEPLGIAVGATKEEEEETEEMEEGGHKCENDLECLI